MYALRASFRSDGDSGQAAGGWRGSRLLAATNDGRSRVSGSLLCTVAARSMPCRHRAEDGSFRFHGAFSTYSTQTRRLPLWLPVRHRFNVVSASVMLCVIPSQTMPKPDRGPCNVSVFLRQFQWRLCGQRRRSTPVRRRRRAALNDSGIRSPSRSASCRSMIASHGSASPGSPRSMLKRRADCHSITTSAFSLVSSSSKKSLSPPSRRASTS